MVYDDQHIVVPVFVLLKGVEVYGYVLPSAVWHQEWLEEARSLVPRAGSSPAWVAIAHISVYISQHASPIVSVFEELVCLVSARVGSRDLIVDFLNKVCT